MMVNTPGFAEAVVLSARTPTLGIGLHFNLTAGPPIDPGACPSLWDVRTGRFHSLGHLALRGAVSPDQVAAECRAQIARLVASGVRVTHVDSHRHVHALPGVWSGVVAAAREAGVLVVRLPVEPPLGRRWLVKACIGASWRLAAHNSGLIPHHTQHFRGLGLLGSATYERDFLALVDALPDGTVEVMVHPGHRDPTLAAWDDYGEPREWELAALCAPSVRTRVARGDIELIHFGEL
jgi:predicted glycoside hydrolase/deacetylase ChbG (UPF0249 family)